MNEAYESGVLNKDVHERLVLDIDRIAQIARVPKKMIWTPLSKNAGPQEIAYVTGFKRLANAEKSAGLLYTGKTSPLTRMQAVCGALVRNFIDARVMTLQEVLAEIKFGGEIDCTCLLIPNFYEGKDMSKYLGSQASDITSMILSRHTQGMQTVLYVSSMSEFKERGPMIWQHVSDNFEEVQL